MPSYPSISIPAPLFIIQLISTFQPILHTCPPFNPNGFGKRSRKESPTVTIICMIDGVGKFSSMVDVVHVIGFEVV